MDNTQDKNPSDAIVLGLTAWVLRKKAMRNYHAKDILLSNHADAEDSGL